MQPFSTEILVERGHHNAEESDGCFVSLPGLGSASSRYFLTREVASTGRIQMSSSRGANLVPMGLLEKLELASGASGWFEVSTPLQSLRD